MASGAESAPTATTTDSAAEPIAETTIKTLPLNKLTQQSARVGVFDVIVAFPQKTTRSYLYNGQPRTSHSFKALLVDINNAKEYILADIHGPGATASKVNALEARFTHGLAFRMSKVHFAENVSRTYNSTRFSLVVSFKETLFSPLLAGPGMPEGPEPSIPIASAMDVDSEQCFDVIGLVKEVGELGNGGVSGGETRVRVQVKLEMASRKAMAIGVP